MNPRVIYFVMAVSLLLGACAGKEPLLTTTKQVVVDVPVSLYNCPVIKTLPDFNTLTERQIAQLIVTLQRNNVTCKNSLNSIKKYIDEVKRITQ